jgi:putative intracellular protease/amidase
VTGWPIGFWLSELTHPFERFLAAGFDIELFSPEGGAVHIDDFSDPRADNGYSAGDEVSSTFLADPARASLLERTRPLAELRVDDFDTVFLVGGQGPMETFRGNPAVERVVAEFVDAGKPTAVVCHATSVLLDARSATGKLIVDGRIWTGFTDAEEEYVESNVGRRFQPFWIESEAARLPNTTFVAGAPMASHAIRSGNLITGQQQNSGAEAAELAIGALR